METSFYGILARSGVGEGRAPGRHCGLDLIEERSDHCSCEDFVDKSQGETLDGGRVPGMRLSPRVCPHLIRAQISNRPSPLRD